MDTILDMLEFHAETHPEKIFLSEEDNQLTFADLDLQVKRCAAILLDQGIRFGDRLVLHQFGRILQLTTYLAAMRIGAIPVLVYSQRSVKQIKATAELTGASLVVTDQDRECWTEHEQTVFQIPDLTNDCLSSTAERQFNKVAYMMLTSGTTGAPKAVMTTHRNIHCVTRNLIRLAKMTQDERELIVMPLGSTDGLGHFHTNLWIGNYTKLAPFFYGSMTRDNLEHMLDTIETDRITGFLSTPGMLGELATSHRESFRQKAANVRYIMANVCPIRPELVKDLISLLPNTRFCTYYGLTEASRSVGQCYNEHPDRISSAGQALSGVDIKIDSNGNEEGEVLIRGGNVTCGYWGRDDALNEDGWLHTGDVGILDEDGFLTIRGRLRDNINIDGFKFFPSEVESILQKHPDVLDCAVFAVPHPIKYQQTAAALVVHENACQEAIQAELESNYLDEVESAKRPSNYLFCAKIPRTELGKIQRDQLAQLMDMSERLATK